MLFSLTSDFFMLPSIGNFNIAKETNHQTLTTVAGVIFPQSPWVCLNIDFLPSLFPFIFFFLD
jgi:hypothetical protein